MKKNNTSRLIEICLWIFCIIFFLPLYFVIVNSLKGYSDILKNPIALPKVIVWDNFVESWKQTKFYISFFNSLVVTGLSTTGIIILASMAGYKLSRTVSKFSGFVFIVFLLGVMVPIQTIMVPIVQLSKALSLNNNLISLVPIYIGTSCSMSVLLYHSFTKSIPYEIEESALIDGCSSSKTFFSIVLPLLKPITSTVMVLTLLLFWNDLIMPLILISNKRYYTITLSQLVFFGEYGQNRVNLLLATAVLASTPVIILYSFTQRFIIGGLVSGAVKG